MNKQAVLSTFDGLQSDGVPDSQVSTTLRTLYENQPTRQRQLGLAFEILGFETRKQVQKKHPTYGFRWNGLDAYFDGEPSSCADFTDIYGETVETDEYKNTKGSYYLTQYVKNPKYSHYTVAATKSNDGTKCFLGKHGKSCLIVGVQVDEFPLERDGSVKKKFRASAHLIKMALLSRLARLSVGTSNFSANKKSVLSLRSLLRLLDALSLRLFFLARACYLSDRQNVYITLDATYWIDRSLITRTTVGVSIPVSLIDRLDSVRGSTPRSRLIVRFVEDGLALMEKKVDNTKSPQLSDGPLESKVTVSAIG